MQQTAGIGTHPCAYVAAAKLQCKTTAVNEPSCFFLCSYVYTATFGNESAPTLHRQLSSYFSNAMFNLQEGPDSLTMRLHLAAMQLR